MRELIARIVRSGGLPRPVPLGLIGLLVVAAGGAPLAQGSAQSRLWVHGADLKSATDAMVFVSAVSFVETPGQEPILGYAPAVLAANNVHLFVDGTPVGPVKVKGFGDSPVGLDVVIAMDVSGSVARHYEFVKRAVLAFVDRRRPGKDQIGLVVFGADVRDEPFTDQVDRLKKFIDIAPSPEMRRSTWFFRGAAQAIQMAARGRPAAEAISLQKTLLLFSDGHDEGGGFTLDEVIRAGQEHQIQVFGLGLPEEGSRNAHHVNLQRLAQGTGGAFVAVNGMAALEQVFARLDHLIKNENVVSFAFPRALADGHEHELRIDATHGGRALSTSIRIRAPMMRAEPPPPPPPPLWRTLVARGAIGGAALASFTLVVVVSRTTIRYRQFERKRRRNAASLESQSQV